MPMFKIVGPTTVKFQSLNTRTENHGMEKVPAMDIFISLPMHADILDSFDPALKDFLFQKYANIKEPDLLGDHEEENEGVLDWRFREIKGIPWEYKGAGYRFVIWSALDDEESTTKRKEDVILIMTNISKFKFAPRKGGEVDVSFKIAASPNAKDAGRLYELQGSEVDISLEPPRL